MGFGLHLKGRVSRPRGAANERIELDLECSDAVTVVENQQRRLVYEGVIFDVTDEALIERPERLDNAFGYFTYVLVEKRTGEIFVGADRLGFSPVYFSDQGDTFRFSSSITLLKHDISSLTPNMDAWDELLVIGDVLGDKTVIKQIERLQWGRKIAIDEKTTRFVSIWDPELPSVCDRDAYIKRNNELLLEALRLTTSVKRARVVTLTGGQDSRRIAVAMRAAGITMTCTTQESIGSRGVDRDALIATEVARALDAPHVRIAVPELEVLQTHQQLKNYWIAYESNYHAWAVSLLRSVPRGALIYDGIVGDVTVNGHFFRAIPDAIERYDDLDHLTQKVCGGRSSGIDQGLVSSPVFERVRAELSRFPASPHRLTFFFILNHTRRNIGSWFNLFHLYRHLPCTPYLYYPLFLQSLALEPTEYLGRWMQGECIRALNSRAAAIPSTRDQVPDSLVIDRSVLASRYDSLRGQLPVRPDVTRYLPGLRRHYLAHRFFERVGLPAIAKRWDWAPDRAGLFSEFLDWVDDREKPAFPATEKVSFVARRSRRPV